MRFTLIVVLCLVMTTAIEAKMRSSGEISSVAIDQRDPNIIYLRLNDLPCKAALSTDGGLTFQGIDERKIPADLSTNLSIGTRRYVVARWGAGANCLFRSDDGGATWTNTGATTFMWEQLRAGMEQEKKTFWKKYGERLPEQSPFWHPLFGLFAGTYFLFTVIALRAQGWLPAIWTALRGVFIILLVWCFLGGFHSFIRHWTGAQFPVGYWPSDEYDPSPKLGVAMAIAARPLYLLVYLLLLWPLLPGSTNVMAGCSSSQVQKRRRLILGFSIAAGIIFIGFHLWMMLIGSFWE